jgi:hypothetical protein
VTVKPKPIYERTNVMLQPVTQLNFRRPIPPFSEFILFCGSGLLIRKEAIQRSQRQGREETSISTISELRLGLSSLSADFQMPM